MTLREVADLTGGWVAPEVATLEIHGVASLGEANPGDLSFYGDPRYLRALRKSRGTAVLVPHGFAEEVPAIRIWVDDPAKAFASLLPRFTPPPVPDPVGIHPTAVIAEDVVLGEGTSIGAHAVVEAGVSLGCHTVVGAHCYIGHGSSVGDHCRFYPNVTIRERCKVANRVILHAGVVIGADGFGYEFKNGAHVKIPQTGIVQIDDDVEIGANSTVDRARFGRTWIQRGTKIDNLVQIGHNVTIGENCVLCAQVGISGSTRVGNYVTMAGKAGVTGHVEIGDRAILTALSGVSKDVPAGEAVGGIPAFPLKEFKRVLGATRRIEKLIARVEALEQRASEDTSA